MKRYIVEIKETLIYRIEVEAQDEEHASEVAHYSSEFCHNMFVANDAETTSVKEVTE